MNEKILRSSAPTAQVRLLCEELLSDGSPHTRKEMEAYIKEKLTLFGIAVPSSGCIAGGIRQAIHNKNCEKLGTALYQAVTSLKEASAIERRADKAFDCLQSAISTLTALAHEIDYITASEQEISELNNLKKCIQDIKVWQQRLQ